ncbi:reverse transcriptase domain-containing protein [Candidatus Enterovibrio escicola]|uniref:reverse transcriptase domain-containing protein n=1 Tax=Candidatus Enterovibrio escicola TaxID=1927127 RepID=UPI001CC26E60
MDILTNKLEHYGIRGLALDWFRSHLSERQQYVYVNDHKSSYQSINPGVPQGSILGTLHFISFINDFVYSSPVPHKVLFADDTNLFFSHKNPNMLEQIINSELTQIDTWLWCNKLSL